MKTINGHHEIDAYCCYKCKWFYMDLDGDDETIMMECMKLKINTEPIYLCKKFERSE